MGDTDAHKGVERPTAYTLPEWMRTRGASDEVVTGVTALVDGMAERHARALLELKRALRARFGRSSEKISPDQLELLFDLMEERTREECVPGLSGAAAELDEGQRKEKAPRKKKRASRRPSQDLLDPEIPRETVQIPVPESEQACGTCGDTMSVLGHDVSEMLEYTPGSFTVKVIEREKRACGRCRDSVVRAPAPSRVVERGRLGAGLIAQILVSKYLDHAPLYRQSQIYERHRVSLPRSTLGDAVAVGADRLQPIARRIGERVVAGDIVSTDDTGLPVLADDTRKGVRRGHLWPYLAGSLVYFQYSPDRGGRWPEEVLRRFRGYVQVDGYSGYDALFRGEACPRIEVGCWMHARRYFVQAVEANDLRALPAVGQIRALYRIEHEAKERALDADARRSLRLERAQPLLDELASWLEEMQPRTPPKTPLGKAIGYTRNRWRALTRYLEEGRLEIDNGAVERIIRIVALGRKNYLFAGSDAGAKRAAILYTVLASCVQHELDPWAYVRDVLEKISGSWRQSDLDRLLPDRWAKEHPHALRRRRLA